GFEVLNLVLCGFDFLGNVTIGGFALVRNFIKHNL
ncbi:hypothetical protein A2U01_0082747, partial [Trifolium medium]|nr:hypothetical protein [Trifolium medium]